VHGASWRARDSSYSRRRLLRRRSLGPVHSERFQVAAAVVDLGWLGKRGRMRQRRRARSVLLPLRVPCIIVSPWTAGGWVCSELFDHTSNLQFLEQVTGVKCPHISTWRRKTFRDFTSVFRFHDEAAGPPTVPDTEAHWERSQYEITTLPKPVAPVGNQVLPEQARGKRPVVTARDR
jgi:phospholipase C